jgi:hypothetical protein
MGMTWWPALVFGWPGPIFAIILSVTGIVRARVAWLFVAAAVIAPFSLYLALNPDAGWAVGLPLLPLVAAGAMSRGSRRMAWLPVMVLTAIVLWIAVGVLSS